MSTGGRLVSETHTPEGTLVIRHLDSHGFRGGHYGVTILTRANGRTISLDLTLAELVGLGMHIDREIKHAAQGGG